MSTGAPLTARRILSSLFALTLFSLIVSLRSPFPASAGTPAPEFTPPPFRSQHFQDIPQLPGTEPNAPEAQVPDAASLYPWARLTFQSFRDNNWEIYSSNDDGSGQTRLTYDGATDMQPRLNRGATRLVFASKRTGNYDIFVMNPDGSGLTQLTYDGKDDAGPYWSPDGSKIVFQAYRDGQAEIYVMNADGSGQTRLTNNSGYDGEPAWSPDGSQIAFVSKRTGGQSDYFLWLMNADGSNQHQLVALPYIGNPVWSPDSTQIAFDTAGADGWQNLWVVNANGSNAHVIFDEGGYADAWAGSWSPSGSHIAFTRIYYTVYNNQLYWTYAYLDACSSPCYSPLRLSASGLDWRPDWQSADIAAPTSSMTALPAESPSPVVLRWSGADVGSSGLQQYVVQVKDGMAGTWAAWNTFSANTTSASYPGVGGHTYYFRIRATDSAGNVEAWPADYDAVTTVEALPPTSAVQALPAYSKNNVTVRWAGADPGRSGIQAYDVQYQDVTAGGNWVNWQMGVTTTVAAFSNGQVGHQYLFRARATDLAQNVEAWPLTEDSHTTIYAWGITGQVFDNTGVPISGAVITTTPTAADVFTSNIAGAYEAYVLTTTQAYTATWSKTGYGDLPATGFGASADASLNAYLPPADNLILDGNFEMNELATSGWTLTGELTPTLTNTLRYTGQQSVIVGTVYSQTGTSTIMQTVTIPPTLTAPVLSFVYRSESKSPLQDGLVAYWNLDETSGTRVDVTGRGNDLADNNTVTSNPGKIRAAAQFIAANQERLSRPDNADLSVGSVDFTVAGWIYLDHKETFNVLASKWDNLGRYEYLLRYNSLIDRFVFEVSSDGTSGNSVAVVSNNAGSPSIGQWYWVAGWRDTHDNTLNIQVNDFPVDSLLYNLAVHDGTADFNLGYAPGGWYHDGRIDEVGIWKRVLTTGEQLALYNNSLGCAYPFISCGPLAPVQTLGAIDQFTVAVDDGITTTVVFTDATLDATSWTHQWIDFSPWVGQAITMTFKVDKNSDTLKLVYLDDISLGSAHPDLWADIDGPLNAPPGGLTTFTLTYGNQGGAPANGVFLTAILPADFSFVEASLPPITTTPALVWGVGTLAGKSGPYSITITATVAPTATTFVDLVTQADIATSSDELETANNIAQASTFIGHRIYLPLIAR